MKAIKAEYEQLAFELWKTGAIQTRRHSREGRGFKLKLHEKQPDAPLSPIYLNLRTQVNPKPGPLTERVVNLAGRYLVDLADQVDLKYEGVAGVPNAGDPFISSFLNHRLYLMHFALEKSVESSSGNRRVVKVSGLFRPGGGSPEGKQVLVVDDLITGAESKIEVIELLATMGAVVKDVVVIVNREQGGVEQLQERGIQTHWLFTLRELLDFYEVAHLLSCDEAEEVRLYLAQ